MRHRLPFLVGAGLAAAMLLALPISATSPSVSRIDGINSPPPVSQSGEDIILRPNVVTVIKTAHAKEEKQARKVARDRKLAHARAVKARVRATYIRSHSFALRGKRVLYKKAASGCDLDCERVVALGHWIQARGFQVSQHPAFGGVCYCHAYGSAHYIAHAIDINWMGYDEMSRLDWLYAQIRYIPGTVIYWRTYGHYDHLHVQFGGWGGGDTP